MKKRKMTFGMLALAFVFGLALSGCDDPTKSPLAPATFAAVTGITGVPTDATAGTDLPLSGTAAPTNATNQVIVWSIQSAGSAGASIVDGNKLHTTAAGTATVRATIAGGLAASSDYTHDFDVAVGDGTLTPAIIANPGTRLTSVTFGTGSNIASENFGSYAFPPDNSDALKTLYLSQSTKAGRRLRTSYTATTWVRI
ncbi:MAG: hypothetical protein LBS82_06550 [Spirochaetaceae bacterium]|jgi:hypothetical protein|nr:hypothetical protein [Spirochaetaceae bacterium]